MIYNNNILHYGKHSLLDIKEQFGTPTYIYSQDVILDNFFHLKNKLKKKAQIHFAVKSCPNIHILRLLADHGSHFDVVSIGEICRLETAGIEASKVIFSGVGKQDNEIEYALHKGIKAFHVESLQELEVIARIAQQKNIQANVSLRINPALNIETHPYLATGLQSSKFGIALELFENCIQTIQNSSSLKLVGLSAHIGSQIRDVSAYTQTLEQLIQLESQVNDAGIELNYLDIGGGFFSPYSGEASFQIEQLSQEAEPILKKTKCQLFVEPGRFIVAQAGWLLSQVIFVKQQNDSIFVVIDAAMNDNLRPSLYQSYHKIKPVQITKQSRLYSHYCRTCMRIWRLASKRQNHQCAKR